MPGVPAWKSWKQEKEQEEGRVLSSRSSRRWIGVHEAIYIATIRCFSLINNLVQNSRKPKEQNEWALPPPWHNLSAFICNGCQALPTCPWGQTGPLECHKQQKWMHCTIGAMWKVSPHLQDKYSLLLLPYLTWRLGHQSDKMWAIMALNLLIIFFSEHFWFKPQWQPSISCPEKRPDTRIFTFSKKERRKEMESS